MSDVERIIQETSNRRFSKSGTNAMIAEEFHKAEMALLEQQSKVPFIIKPRPDINEPIFIDDSKKRHPHEYRTHGGHRKHGHKRRK